jgi:polyribonucleotide nucleotidyltransferase
MMIVKKIDFGGKEFSFETGRLAKQADGAVMVRYADTMVLATVVGEKKPKEGADYFPLQVEYREKISAIGKIPGGFLKREGRPSEKEILSARLIDRPIRPMFSDSYRNETQIVVTVFSSDMQHDGDTLGAVAASAALMVSGIPFDGPIAEVKVGRVDGAFIVNPTYDELSKSDMDVTVAGTADSIVMVEGESKEISEADMVAALKFAHEYINILCTAQKELAAEVKKPLRAPNPTTADEALREVIRGRASDPLKALSREVLAKEERAEKTSVLFESVIADLEEQYPDKEIVMYEIFHEIEKHAMRSTILEEGKRLDGRGLRDIRPITCEVGILPRTHGSALFTRGETQSLTTATLGSKLDEQRLEGLLPETSKRFMLHYNFPPFSVGEVGRYGGVGRREIGHGNLAERSLKNMLPDESEFGYTIRVVSDILESNGSSSMATVCAGSLALFDAGVKLKKSIAGIAMGLVKEGDNVAILSDILGNEDHLGDMDFKVAGTKDGITAFQMDIKIKGISFGILENALAQAKEGRFKILEKMDQAIIEPRSDISRYAPRVTMIRIPIDTIGAVIGPGGKIIREITSSTNSEINIEDDGSVKIFAVERESADRAVAMIQAIAVGPEVGKIYNGKVKKIMDFGAFVEILPGKEGLLHISQIALERVAKVDDVLKVGDMIEVKLLRVEDSGKFALSRKAVLDPNSVSESDSAPRQRSGSGDRHRHGDRDRHHNK